MAFDLEKLAKEWAVKEFEQRRNISVTEMTWKDAQYGAELRLAQSAYINGAKAFDNHLFSVKEKNKKLVEALEYYAGKNAWYLQKDLVTGAEVRRSIEYADTESGSRIDDAGNNILVINGGKRARTALEENENGKEKIL